ncbi:DUF3626 domain-containing protein [Nocardia sp. R7R-8]|uniref:DUF3626 domain-containing protein n=1 Tax=Nocardia sp. R7R-8 TaxID=3459304 RepID=UPI00403D6E44
MSPDTGSIAESPQQRAIRHVAASVRGPALDPALRVTLNFHPDRIVARQQILAKMADDGVYLSQFATGVSNGGLTAYPGGDRWHWEHRIFAGAYDHVTATERPVYGALNFRDQPHGGAPRFGSSFFRLTAETLARTTFCYPDSSTEPTDFAVADHFSLIELAEAGGLDILDGHIEAHVHGPVRFERDVEALVLDPSYRNTSVAQAATRLPCRIEWHPGFRLSVDQLRRHPAFRGPRYVELGAQIAVDGQLDPRIIGDAARTNRHDPRDLKKVWHYLARFGQVSEGAHNGCEHAH